MFLQAGHQSAKISTITGLPWRLAASLPLAPLVAAAGLAAQGSVFLAAQGSALAAQGLLLAAQASVLAAVSVVWVVLQLVRTPVVISIAAVSRARYWIFIVTPLNNEKVVVLAQEIPGGTQSLYNPKCKSGFSWVLIFLAVGKILARRPGRSSYRSREFSVGGFLTILQWRKTNTKLKEMIEFL
jgi:hypothetical protein